MAEVVQIIHHSWRSFAPTSRAIRCISKQQRHKSVQSRCIHIISTSTTSNLESTNLSIPNRTTSSSSSSVIPDAQFEVLGNHASLLSASISASQPLYTRKGSLVGFNGKPENTVSTLSLLEPFRRIVTGIPFLYQKITSTSPFTALISSGTTSASFSIIQLDGRLDWLITRRNALLAWTGHTLTLKPQVNTSLSVSHWGNTFVTGRGLVCLSGKGQIYEINLKTAGEEYIIHPSNVVGYTITSTLPIAYRFKSSTVKLQIPNVIGSSRFLQSFAETPTYSFLSRVFFGLRSWTRRMFRGDGLFLQFTGPARILVQSRGNNIRESLSREQMDEIADSPVGVIKRGDGYDEDGKQKRIEEVKVGYANVEKDGKVVFEKS